VGSDFSAANTLSCIPHANTFNVPSALPRERVVFSVNLRLVEYIPDYYDPNNSQVASRVTINSLERNVMSDLYYATATLRKNNIVMSQWIPWDFLSLSKRYILSRLP